MGARALTTTHRVRRRRRADDGGRARAAHARAAAHHGHRGRHRRAAARSPASCRSPPTRCAPAYRAQMLPGITDAFLLAQRGFLDVGFIGGAQIDQYGNLNTSAIGGYDRKPTVRLPGSGGANDIISLCREVMILTVHEKRRFTERVDFVTSPGYLARRRRPAQERPPVRRRLAHGHHARRLRLRAGEPAHAARLRCIPASPSRRCRPTPASRCW